MTKNRYTFAQRLLHWLIALLVFGLLAVGFTFMALDFEGTEKLFGEATTKQLYMLHKSFGVLLLLLMVLRLLLRRASPPPPYDTPLKGYERVVAGAIHLSFYLLLIAMPIVGWVATASAGYPISFFEWTLPGLAPENKELAKQLMTFHGYGGFALLVLIVLHVGAGLKHWRLKDGIMGRISLP